MNWLDVSLLISLTLVFAAMSVAIYMYKKYMSQPACFGSDPDPLRQAYRKCNECEERGECLE